MSAGPAEHPLRRTPRALAAAVAALAWAAGLAACGPDSGADAPAAAGAPTAPAPTSAPLPGPQPLTEEAVTVVSVEIPVIGVAAAPLESLPLLPDGSLAAPVDFARAGWFSGGTLPGDQGPAVIAGHVDSVDGPAVFFRLRELRAGDEVVVGLSDGTSVTFRVNRTEQAPKDDFPTEEVYGPTPDAELRLITCGGDFDRVERSYLDNTVVFATAV